MFSVPPVFSATEEGRPDLAALDIDRAARRLVAVDLHVLAEAHLVARLDRVALRKVGIDPGHAIGRDVEAAIDPGVDLPDARRGAEIPVQPPAELPLARVLDERPA